MSDDVEMGKELAKVGGGMGGGAAVLFLFQKLFSTDSKTADAIESLRAEIHGMRNDMNMTMQSGEQHEKDLKALHDELAQMRTEARTMRDEFIELRTRIGMRTGEYPNAG